MSEPTRGPVPPPHASRSRARTLLAGTRWQAMAQLAPLVVNLALTPFVITHLGQIAYGYYLLVAMLTQLLGQFDGGIGRSAQRYFTLYAGRGDAVAMTRLLTTLLLILTVLATLSMGVTFVLAPGVATFFHTPEAIRDDTILLLRVLVVLVGVALARSVFSAVLAAHQRFAVSSGTLMMGYVVYAAGTVYVLSHGLGLRGMAYVFIAQQAAGSLAIVPSAMRHLDRAGIGLIGRDELRAFLAFAWKVQVSGLLNVAALEGVTLIVGRMMDPSRVALFAPGATFAQQLRAMPANALAPIQAMLGRAIGSFGASGARSEFLHIQRWWVLGVTGWVAAGAPAAYVGVNAWLPLNSSLPGTVASVLLVSHLFGLLRQVFLQWALLLGRPDLEMWTQLANVGLTLGLTPVLIPHLGVLGVAAATVVGQLTAFVLAEVLARGLPVPVPSPLRVVPWGPGLVCAALSAGCVAVMGRLIDAGTVPRGAIGLVAAGLAAVPALVVYVALTIGPRRMRELARRRPRFGDPLRSAGGQGLP